MSLFRTYAVKPIRYVPGQGWLVVPAQQATGWQAMKNGKPLARFQTKRAAAEHIARQRRIDAAKPKPALGQRMPARTDGREPIAKGLGDLYHQLFPNG